MKKQAITMILVLGMVLGSSISVMAADIATIKVDGQAITFEEKAQPYIKDGKNFVPIRPIVEALGAKNIQYTTIQEQPMIVFDMGDMKKAIITDSGKGKTTVKNGRMYAPIRQIILATGDKLTFDAKTNTIEINAVNN